MSGFDLFAPVKKPIDADAIPIEIKAILEAVRREAPEAVIAGGYLRDLNLGAPFVDVDIFVRADRHEDARGLEWSLESEGFDLLESCDLTAEKAEEYRKHFGGDLIGVSTFRFGEIKVQIVSLDVICPLGEDDFTEAVLDRIDFGACRIAFDGLKVIFRPEYERDIRDGTFTLVFARNGAAVLASVKRFERWRERYPDATFELWEPIVADWRPVPVGVGA